MRFVIVLGLALVGAASEARAQDFGPLRGSQIEVSGGTDWNGVYVGAHAGLNGMSADFGKGTKSIIAHMLRNTTIEDENHISDWTTLGDSDTRGSHYGAFAGYNVQFESVVLGVEASYNRTDLRLSSSDGMGRIFSTSDGYTNSVRVDTSASLQLTDYGTLRLRGGWAVGNFLPYGFIGAAVGRASVSRAATVNASGTHAVNPPNPPYAFTQTVTQAKADDFMYGVAAGFGVEFALFQNFFVRAEYEYIRWGEFNDLNTYMQSVRVGGGVKF